MGTSSGYSWSAAEDEKFSSRESDAINLLTELAGVLYEMKFAAHAEEIHKVKMAFDMILEEILGRKITGLVTPNDR